MFGKTDQINDTRLKARASNKGAGQLRKGTLGKTDPLAGGHHDRGNSKGREGGTEISTGNADHCKHGHPRQREEYQGPIPHTQQGTKILLRIGDT